jgi:hypothetical protein
MLGLICILLALIFFALSTLGVPGHPRFNFQSAGLFFLALWMFLGSHPHFS